MSSALRCDGCGVFAQAETPVYPMHDAPLPSGWLRVYVFDKPRDGVTEAAERHEVCSRRCAADCLDRRQP